MKAYVAPIPTTLSRGIHRVADALARYAPADVEIVTDIAGADFLVCHVIGPEGWGDILPTVRRYAIVQYCLRTTTWPYAASWRRVWERAEVVASYYDLAGVWREEFSHATPPNFLRVPLGVDTAVFNPGDWGTKGKDYLVGTSGFVAGTECVGEWAAVCNAVDDRQFHLGPDLPELAHRRQVKLGIADSELAQYYAACRFVSGLRRSEGFELPAFEGLACGARPVMFYREDALYWLGPHAEYVQEGSPEYVIAQLTALMRLPYRPVEDEEIAWVRKEFTWQRMATAFWAQVPR